MCTTPEVPGLCSPLGSISLLGALGDQGQDGQREHGFSPRQGALQLCTLVQNICPRALGPEVSSSESVPASRDDLAAGASAVKLRVILALLVPITNLSSLLSRSSSQFFCFHISYLMLAWPQVGGQMWHLRARGVSSRVPTHRLPSLHLSISSARSENKFSAAFELSRRAVLFCFFRCTVYRAVLWNLRVRGVVEARLL